jgi:sigma-E factor negative regulatory protein RseA
MNKETQEHLSCLMDGEISRDTGRFLVRRLGADEELCATWTRYHLVRDCLRHQDGDFASLDLCQKVSEALAGEQASNRARSWFKPAAGMAIAASVALMAVMAVGPSGPGTPQSDAGTADALPLQSFTSPQGLGSAPVSRQASIAALPEQRQKMDAYLLRHYQATGSTGGKGFVAFIPVVITRDSSAAEKQLPEKSANPRDGEEDIAQP